MSDARSTARTTLEHPAQPGDLQGAELAVPLRLTQLIGAGGMGEVWEARSADLPGMRFAIKVVSQAHAHSKLVVARFFGEARAAAAIDHPNILIIHGTGRTGDGRPALVMQYIEGSSLSELCEERGPLPIDAAGKIDRSDREWRLSLAPPVPLLLGPLIRCRFWPRRGEDGRPRRSQTG